MKTVDKTEVRTIHPDVANDMTMDAAIVMLGVAHDLRSGAITKDHFNMKNFTVLVVCGTAHCICGWVEKRLGKHRRDFIKLIDCESTRTYRANGLHGGWPPRLYQLFGAFHELDPVKAACHRKLSF